MSPIGNATNSKETEHQETVNFTSNMTVNPGNSFGDSDIQKAPPAMTRIMPVAASEVFVASTITPPKVTESPDVKLMKQALTVER